MTRRFKLAIALWLAASLTGKAIRYAVPAIDREAQSLAAIDEFVGTAGWSRKHIENGPETHLFVYRKAGCSGPLFVAMLGTGAETAPLLRDKFHGSLTFFQSGKSVASPSVWRGNLEQAGALAAGLLSGRAPAAHPAFAVSPAPGKVDGPCVPPIATDWVRFLSRFR